MREALEAQAIKSYKESLLKLAVLQRKLIRETLFDLTEISTDLDSDTEAIVAGIRLKLQEHIDEYQI